MNVAGGGATAKVGPPSGIDNLTAEIAEAEENISGVMEAAERCHIKLFGPCPIEPRGGADAPPLEGSIPAHTARLSEINASLRWAREVLAAIDTQAG